jgi:hypothetical protein
MHITNKMPKKKKSRLAPDTHEFILTLLRQPTIISSLRWALNAIKSHFFCHRWKMKEEKNILFGLEKFLED